MRVLITGADGFIGSNLQTFLRQDDEEFEIDKFTLDNTEDELEEKINTHGVKYLKMHRQGLDFDHIKTHIEKAKKRKNSILNRLFRKIANKIKAL